MRAWYVIKNGKEIKCDFISVNTLKGILWLRVDKKSFKVTFINKGDFLYAKRGEVIKADASNKKEVKSIQIVFK